MYEFLIQNQLYIVLCVVLLTWAGIVLYLVRMDKRLKRLEKKLYKN
jgi:CcmD family protein